VGAADLQQPGTQLGVRGERLDCGFHEGALGGAITWMNAIGRSTDGGGASALLDEAGTDRGSPCCSGTD
jgi:hypothetical protein